MSTVIDFERANVSFSLDDFIAASGARLSDRIIIAGARHLELLLSLTRRGFSSVTCQSPNRGPHIPHDKANVILAPAVASEAALLAIIAGLGSALLPGGALVLQPAVPLSATGEAALHVALRAKGFSEIDHAGAFWRAIKQPPALARAA